MRRNWGGEKGGGERKSEETLVFGTIIMVIVKV